MRTSPLSCRLFVMNGVARPSCSTGVSAQAELLTYLKREMAMKG
jgi:hypothetical protein